MPRQSMGQQSQVDVPKSEQLAGLTGPDQFQMSKSDKQTGYFASQQDKEDLHVRLPSGDNPNEPTINFPKPIFRLIKRCLY